MVSGDAIRPRVGGPQQCYASEVGVCRGGSTPRCCAVALPCGGPGGPGSWRTWWRWREAITVNCRFAGDVAPRPPRFVVVKRCELTVSRYHDENME